MGIIGAVLQRLGHGYARGGFPVDPNDPPGGPPPPTPGDGNNTNTQASLIWGVPTATWNSWDQTKRNAWVFGPLSTFGSQAYSPGPADYSHWFWVIDSNIPGGGFWAAGTDKDHPSAINVAGYPTIAAGKGVPFATSLPALPKDQTDTYGVSAPGTGGPGTNDTSGEAGWQSQLLNILGQIAGFLAPDTGSQQDKPDPILKALEDLNKKYDRDLGLLDQQIQIDELNGDTQKELTDLQKKGQLLQQKGVDLQALLAQTTVGSDQWYAIMSAINDNTIAQLQNTQAIDKLNGQGTQVQDWSSRAWQWFRVAIFNGIGSLLPQYDPTQGSGDGGSGGDPGASMPALGNPGAPTYSRSGVSNVSFGSDGNMTYLDDLGIAGGGGKWGDYGWKRGGGQGGDVHVHVTNPTETADPVYLGSQIAWRIKNLPSGGRVRSR